MNPRWLKWLPASWRRKLVAGQVRFEPEQLHGVTVRLPETFDEYAQASRLLFESYTDCGLIAHRGVRVRINAFLAMPGSMRLVAVKQGKVIGTVSLVPDEDLGLPMDDTYGEEVAVLRQQGRRLVEVGALAIDKAYRHSGLALLMCKGVYWLGKSMGATDLVAGVRPMGEVIYRDLICFERLGPPRHYAGLKSDVVTVAQRLDLQQSTERLKSAFARSKTFNTWRYFYETATPQLQLPTTQEGLAATRPLHVQAALRLLALRPDVLIALRDQQFERLSAALARPSPPAAPAYRVVPQPT